ncbi:MAG: DUF6702 family protein [Bacteroidota bacterium]
MWTNVSVVPQHEYHLSKCNIEYNEKEQALQITLHLFIDDLEEALKHAGSGQLYIGTEKEKAEADEFIGQYIRQKFWLNDGKQNLSFDFLGKERTEDLAGIYCFLEVTNITNIQELTVTNQVLMEVFDDQKNIVHIVGPNKQMSYFLFQKGQSTESVTF